MTGTDDRVGTLKRGEVWWAEPPEERPRPVLILTRDRAIGVMQRVLVAPLTTTVRDIPTEVALDHRDGVPRRCVVSLDNVAPLSKTCLVQRITQLSPQRMAEVRRALTRATGG